jgi:hypothetical protein
MALPWDIADQTLRYGSLFGQTLAAMIQADLEYLEATIPSGGVTSFNTRTGAVTLTQADVTTALATSANGLSLIQAANYSAMRTLLSLVPGTNVQAYSANLTTFAAIAPSANVVSFLGAADYSAMRTALSLVPGTNVQAFSANLTTYAGIAPGALGQAILPMTTLTEFGVVIGAGASAPTATAVGSAGQVLTSNGAGVAPTFQAVAGGATATQVILTYETAAGAGSASYATAAWRQIPINTEVRDDGGLVSISGGQVTFAAGTWELSSVMSLSQNNVAAAQAMSRLYDITNAAAIAYGLVTSVAYDGTDGERDGTMSSVPMAVVTFAGATVVELQVQGTTTLYNSSVGPNFGVSNIWAFLVGKKIS